MSRYVSIMADIHSNYEAMKAVVESIKNDNPWKDKEYLGNIFAGDLIDYGANPESAFDMFKTIKPLVQNDLVVGTLGNHDIAVLDQDYSRFRTEHGKKSAEWTARHTPLEVISYLRQDFNHYYFHEGLFMMVCHGNDVDPWVNVFPKDKDKMDDMIDRHPEMDIFIIVHSHLQFVTTYRGTMFINPGSVGQSRNGIPKAHYALLDLDTQDVEFIQVSYDIASAARKIKKVGLDIFLGQRLYLGI